MPQALDGIYFTRRSRQSLAAVKAATDPGARLAHKQLAAAYDALANPPQLALIERSAANDAKPDQAAIGLADDQQRDALASWANDGGTK